MSRAAVAAALLLGAGLLHFGYTVPARREALVLAEEHRRALVKRQEVRERRERLEQRRAEFERVSAVLASVARGSADPAGDLRRVVLEILRDSDLLGVRLSVGPGRETVGAVLQVSGRGGIADVVRFSGALVQPNTGVVLERVRLSVQPSAAIDFEIAGARLGRAR